MGVITTGKYELKRSTVCPKKLSQRMLPRERVVVRSRPKLIEQRRGTIFKKQAGFGVQLM